MNKRKFAHIVSFLCIILAAILCFQIFHSPIFNPGRIYENDSLIVMESDTYHANKSINMFLNESQKSNFSAQHFSGATTVEIIKISDGGSIAYHWNVIVEQGKFKIVLIDMQNAVVAETMCEGSGNGDVGNYNLAAGEYRVKFIGDNATVEGEFGITKN